MDFSQLGNSAAQAAVKGGMRTTSTMQRPSDDAANARARARRRRKKNRGNNGQLSAQDMIALFQSMPTPNRGFRLPGGDKPDFMGGSMDQFYAKNPSIAQGPARADQIAQERQQQLTNGFAAGRSTVQEKLAEQQMPRTPSSAYGTGSVTFTDKPTRGTMTDPLTGKQVFMDEYLPQQSKVQDTKYGAMPGQENGGALARPRAQPPKSAAQSPSDMAALFPGVEAGQRSAPSQDFGVPSWVQDALIKPEMGYQPRLAQASQPSVTNPQAPPVTGIPSWSPDWMRTSTPPDNANYLQPDWMSQQQTYAPVDDTPGAARQQSLSGAFPAGKMQGYTPPNSSPQQLEALRRLSGLFGSQSPGSAGLESVWTNILPGQKDWQGLESLFPGVVQPGVGNTQNMRRLQTMYQDPVYQSRW